MGGPDSDVPDSCAPDTCAPDTPVPGQRASGEVVSGRYRLERVLGRGGMADVYLATDQVLQRQVALKRYRPTPRIEGARERFEFEVKLAASLDHGQLVRVYDAGVDGGQPWYVMQLVTGGTLRDLPAPPPLARIYRIAADLAWALDHLHCQGVLHRDVKPSNVLLGERGEAYLADFGIAEFVQVSVPVEAPTVVVGTPSYLSPEQVRGGPSSAAADVYALGLVLLEALTGHREYSGEPVTAALERLHRAPEIPVGTDPGFAGLVRAMTDSDEKRRPTAADVGRRVEFLATAHRARLAAVAAAPAAAAAPRARVTTPRRRGRTAPDARRLARRVPVPAAALATLGVAALLALAVSLVMPPRLGGSAEPASAGAAALPVTSTAPAAPGAADETVDAAATVVGEAGVPTGAPAPQPRPTGRSTRSTTGSAGGGVHGQASTSAPVPSDTSGGTATSTPPDSGTPTTTPSTAAPSETTPSITEPTSSPTSTSSDPTTTAQTDSTSSASSTADSPVNNQ